MKNGKINDLGGSEWLFWSCIYVIEKEEMSFLCTKTVAFLFVL